MFWKKKKKLPITEEDRVWVNEELNWLKKELGYEHFSRLRTVTPTKKNFDRTFDGTEKDAEFILQQLMKIMYIEEKNIHIEYFSDSQIEMADGTVLSTPADISGKWNSASGTYEQTEQGVIISIERSQLKNTISLVATISHELSHFILLGEDRIEENDEYLTDLTAIVYGFGIFIGNSKFSFSKFRTNYGSGWESKSQGYLPEEIIAYAMAWLSVERNENTDYSKFLTPTMKKYFERSLEWLKEN